MDKKKRKFKVKYLGFQGYLLDLSEIKHIACLIDNNDYRVRIHWIDDCEPFIHHFDNEKDARKAFDFVYENFQKYIKSFGVKCLT